MSTSQTVSMQAWLTRMLFLRMMLGVGLLSLFTFGALHLLLVRQQDANLERRVVKLTDIVVKAERDGVTLAERLADYAPRRPGTRLRVRDASGQLIYEDPDLPAHQLSPHVRERTFEPAHPDLRSEGLRFNLLIDVSEDAELARAMGGLLLAITLIAAAGAGLLGSTAVRKGLRPLERFSEQIARINPAHLDERLQLEKPIQELQPWVDRFNGLMARLERAYQQLESFNADVAHELRTPLNNLIGQTEVAMSRTRSIEQLQDTLSSNLEELHRLGSLVNDMLFLSRADRGARARREVPTSLASLVIEVVEFYDASLEERGLRVSILGDAHVAVDAGLVRRALSNLLSNAIRHAAPQSHIQITIKTADDSGGRVVTLGVLNEGSPIAPEHLPRIFDRFFRADTSRQATGVNHGLGLAIVSAIARMHGGVPVVQSTHAGTNVGFTIRTKLVAEQATDSSHLSRGSVNSRCVEEFAGQPPAMSANEFANSDLLRDCPLMQTSESRRR